MDVSAIIIFIAKVLFIDVMIELLRQAAYAIQHNAWAGKLLKPKNRYFYWFLGGFETLATILLLYLGYSIIFIILVLFLLTTILKYLADKLFSK